LDGWTTWPKESNITLDVWLTDQILNPPTYLLPIRCTHEFGTYELHGILLQPASSKGTFQRIGYAFVRSEEVGTAEMLQMLLEGAEKLKDDTASYLVTSDHI
jgi:hypothetical protein